MSVVVCTDLSDREPHTQVGMDRTIASEIMERVPVKMPTL